MKEKKLYVDTQGNEFALKSEGLQVVKKIRFSDDVRDFGYIAENIPCQHACPAKTNIPGYIRCITEKRYGRSYELNRCYNIFPGVLGRICSRPCEPACRHGETDLGKSVNICHLKRCAADMKSSWHRIKEDFYAPTGKQVAVIGGGPAGLAAAHELTTLGHSVTIFESMEKPGGMLMYGIPEFRLPRDVLSLEINNILRLGVTLKTGVHVGRDITLKELMAQFDAVIATTGCMQAFKLNVPGEDLSGVYSGLDFMMRVNAGEKPYVGDRVAVIGGGFTAMDCSRVAIRLGARSVSVNLRRTEEYMRVDEHEKHEAKFEKVKIYGLVQPKEIVGKNGKVTGIVFTRTRLEFMSVPPFRKAVPIDNSEFEVPVDTVICAIGQFPDTQFIDTDIKMDGKRIQTHKDSLATDATGFFAAGDCVEGATNVITAVAKGRQAAQEVDRYLVDKTRRKQVVRFEPTEPSDRERGFDFIPQSKMRVLDFNDRLADMNREVELGYDAKAAEEEAKRCYLCYHKYEIDIDRCIYCSACIDVAPRDCIKLIKDVEVNEDGTYGQYVETKDWQDVVAIAIDNKRCIRCGQCYEVCPMKCISVTKVELIEQDLEA